MRGANQRIRVRVLALAAGTVFLVLVLPPASLLGVRPNAPSIVHTVTIVNRSGADIYFKIVGGIGKPFVEASLKPNLQVREPVTNGEKVLCVWNTNGNLLAAWRLVVIGDRTITIPAIDPSDHSSFCDLGDGSAAPAPQAQPDPPQVEKAP